MKEKYLITQTLVHDEKGVYLSIGETTVFLTREEVSTMRHDLEVVEMELDSNKDTELLDGLPQRTRAVRAAPGSTRTSFWRCVTSAPRGGSGENQEEVLDSPPGQDHDRCWSP